MITKDQIQTILEEYIHLEWSDIDGGESLRGLSAAADAIHKMLSKARMGPGLRGDEPISPGYVRGDHLDD